MVNESDKKLPTLLHFSAKHGLQQLCLAIMDTPGSSTAFQIQNKDGHGPADLARLNGYKELAQLMRDHFESSSKVECIQPAFDSDEGFKKEEKSSERDIGQTQCLDIHSTQPEMKAEDESTIMEHTSAIETTDDQELLEISYALKTKEFTIEEAERYYAEWQERYTAINFKPLSELREALDKLHNSYKTEMFCNVKIYHNVNERDRELPTLLHFSAKHGLQQLCLAIMDTHGSSTAFQIQNKDGQDLADLARLNGNEELAQHMRDHFETNSIVECIQLVLNSCEDLKTDEHSIKKDSARSQCLDIQSTQPKTKAQDNLITTQRELSPCCPGEYKFQGVEQERNSFISAPIIGQTSYIRNTDHEELQDISNALKAGEFTIEEAERLYIAWQERYMAINFKSLSERREALDRLHNEYTRHC